MRPVFLSYADNFFLPFALLADNTFLPPAVLILDLKPCTLALCALFGWNVIFIGMHLLYTTGLKYKRTSVILLCILEYHVYYIRIPYFRQVDFSLFMGCPACCFFLYILDIVDDLVFSVDGRMFFGAVGSPMLDYGLFSIVLIVYSFIPLSRLLICSINP